MAAGLPTSIVVEIEFSAGVWTAVTTDVVGDSVEITVGKDSPAGDIQPGVLDLVLDNAAGTWTPDNPTSTYYPNVVEGKRIRVTVAKGASTSTRFVGRITLWEPDFPDVPQQSRTRVQAVDALGDLARNTMPPTLMALVRAAEVAFGDTPPYQTFFYWPLRGGYQLVDSIGGVGRLSFYQPSSGGEVSWNSDSSFPSGGDPCLELTAGVGIQFGNGAFGQWGNAATGGVTVSLNLNSGSAGIVLTSGDSRPTSSGFNGWALHWNGTSTLSLREYIAGAVSSTPATVSVTPGWHVLTIDSSGTQQLIVDGVSITPAAFVFAGPFRVITVGGLVNVSIRDLLIGTNGYLYHPYLVDTGAFLDTITTQVSAQGSVSSLGTSLVWTTPPSAIRAAPPLVDGRTLLDVVSDLASSQAGVAYVAYTSSSTQPITMLSNVDSRPATVALTLDAEADLLGGPTLDRNVYNKVASATASNASTSVNVADPALAATYGTSTADKSTVLATTNALAAAASDLIAQTKSSKLRLSNLTFDLVTAANDRYAAFFGLTPGERVRLNNLTSTYFGVTQMDGYVLGWTERPGITGYPVTLRLQPAEAPAEAKYDDTTYGRFGWADGAATVTGGTAVGTTATGTLIITTSSGPTLSTAAGSYPMQLDWNGECVTITSAPASGVSPQTVTITARGQNGTVARTHSTGERVDVWLSGRFAL